MCSIRVWACVSLWHLQTSRRSPVPNGSPAELPGLELNAPTFCVSGGYLYNSIPPFTTREAPLGLTQPAGSLASSFLSSASRVEIEDIPAPATSMACFYAESTSGAKRLRAGPSAKLSQEQTDVGPLRHLLQPRRSQTMQAPATSPFQGERSSRAVDLAATPRPPTAQQVGRRHPGNDSDPFHISSQPQVS